jgi:hypothetical protein
VGLATVSSLRGCKIIWYSLFYLHTALYVGHALQSIVLVKPHTFILRNKQHYGNYAVSLLEQKEKLVLYFVTLADCNPMRHLLNLLRLEWRIIEVCVLLLMTASAYKCSGR